MSKAIERIKERANRLAEVRRSIDALKEKQDAVKLAMAEEMSVLFTEKDSLQEALIKEFNKEGLTSIKSESGESYTKAVKAGIAVTDEVKAMAWAKEHKMVREKIELDLIKIKAALEPMAKAKTELPAGFEAKEVEYISVRAPKKEEAPAAATA